MDTEDLELLAPYAPMALAIFFGWLLGIIALKKHRRPAILVLLAMTLLTLVFLFETLVFVELIFPDWENPDWLYERDLWQEMIIRGVYAVVLVMLVCAAFVGRKAP